MYANRPHAVVCVLYHVSWLNASATSFSSSIDSPVLPICVRVYSIIDWSLSELP